MISVGELLVEVEAGHKCCFSRRNTSTGLFFVLWEYHMFYTTKSDFIMSQPEENKGGMPDMNGMGGSFYTL
ncbi:hypothetical protein V7157_15415 [Neobacillus drentensis]|uniref:hypothetical protein n=1 Tax=Neobacillus drentensis TaxID=220684 RepID=UPI0030032790